LIAQARERSHALVFCGVGHKSAKSYHRRCSCIFPTRTGDEDCVVRYHVIDVMDVAGGVIAIARLPDEVEEQKEPGPQFRGSSGIPARPPAALLSRRPRRP
jgi:hypothetical protein